MVHRSRARRLYETDRWSWTGSVKATFSLSTQNADYSSHRIRMASSPSGSLRLFFSASFAFFFFLKLIFSFSRLDLSRCSRWAVCGDQALALPLLTVIVDGCLTLLLTSLSSRCCLILLTTRNTNRGTNRSRQIAMATTAHIHTGVGSLKRKNKKQF